MKNNLNLNTKTSGFLTQAEKEKLILTSDEKEILVGLVLGDLFIFRAPKSVNPNLYFEQGLVHEEYLLHLYNLFESYCSSAPKITSRTPDKRTGKVYSRIRFQSRSLSCFKMLHELFYLEGKKRVPLNIFDLLTPLGLCYWICDDGTFSKRDKCVVLCTQSFTLEEVKLLIEVLTKKFDLDCTMNRSGKGHVIRISQKSLPKLQSLLTPHMPNMMRYKIGLA